MSEERDPFQSLDILLIYEVIPDYTKIYLFRDLSEEIYNKMLKCHLKFINNEENDEIHWFADNEVAFEQQLISDSRLTKVPKDPPEYSGKIRIIHCGFVL